MNFFKKKSDIQTSFMVGIFFVLYSLVINESRKYFSITFIQSVEHLHVTSTHPYWCYKKMK